MVSGITGFVDFKKDVSIQKDIRGGKQPMSFMHEGNEYIIVYNGQIYNTKELKQTLEENNFKIDSQTIWYIIYFVSIYG